MANSILNERELRAENSETSELEPESSSVAVKVVYEPSTEARTIFLFEGEHDLSDTLLPLQRLYDAPMRNTDFKILCIQYCSLKRERRPDYFRMRNEARLRQLIPAGSRIVAFGSAVNLLIPTKDTKIDNFDDQVLGQTYVYDSQFESYIFPVYTLEELREDAPKREFAAYQIKTAFECDLYPQRRQNVQCVAIGDQEEFFRTHNNASTIAVDIETTSLDPFDGEILFLSLSFDGRTGYFVDWKDLDVRQFNMFLEGKSQIYANGKFDCLFLRRNGVTNCRVGFDVVAAGRAIHNHRSNGLKNLAWYYTNLGGYEGPVETAFSSSGNNGNRSYAELDQQLIQRYAAFDALVTHQVYQSELRHIDEICRRLFQSDQSNLHQYLEEVVFPAINMFIDVELEGISVDPEKLQRIGQSIAAKVEEAKREVFEEMACQFAERGIAPLSSLSSVLNIDSPVQLGFVLEHCLGLPALRRTKKMINTSFAKDLRTIGIPTAMGADRPVMSVDEASLSTWVSTDSKVAKKLLSYRKLAKAASDLGNLSSNCEGANEKPRRSQRNRTGIAAQIKADGKVHPSYNVSGARTGRNLASKPNFQNQTKHHDLSAEFRSIYTVPSGDFVIGEVDYSNFQLRIVASESGDPLMTSTYQQADGDIHSETAKILVARSAGASVGDNGQGNVETTRRIAKGANFGFAFGLSAFGFARTLHETWPIQVARAYVQKNQLEELREWFLDNRDRFSNFGLSRAEHDEFSYFWPAAYDIREKFFQKYNALGTWQDSVRRLAAQHGYVISAFGALGRYPELKKPDGTYFSLEEIRGSKYNEALNFPIQNAEACIMNMNMVELHTQLIEQKHRSRIIAMIHDSVVLYVHKDEIDTVEALVRSIFERPVPQMNDIPLQIEGTIADPLNGECWGFGHSWF